MSLLKALATVSGMTGISRITGFVRDILTANILGAGAIADAFFVALKLPNLFRRITGEGALSVAFVPTYTEKDEKEGREAAKDYAGRVTSVLTAILLPFSIMAIWLMPYVIQLIAPGFEVGETRYDMAIEFSRITFFYLVLISLTALMGAVLNAHDRFAPFAFAPVLFNLTLIGFLLASGHFANAGVALSWGILISGVIQLIFLGAFLKRFKLNFSLKIPRLTPDIKKLFKLMGPGVIGAGVMQINIFVDIILASLLPAGAISSLYYADRLNQLPLGIIGIAIGTALLPMLSRAVSAFDVSRIKDLFYKSLFFGLMLTIPAATALAIIPQLLIGGLFEHGAFDRSDTLLTASVLQAYAYGLPAYIVFKIFSTLHFAHQNTLTPVKVSIITVLTNTALSIMLIQFMGAAGIALATSIAAWVQVIIYFFLLKKERLIEFDATIIQKLMRIIMATAVMACVLLGLNTMIDLVLPLKLAMIVMAGLMAYGLSVFVFKVVSLSELKQYLKKD
jgi:putative peptidoglycan lipid II flippase